MTEVEKKPDTVEVDFDHLDSMNAALKANGYLKEKMDIITKNYQTVDVSIAMNALANVADVLKLAYAGSKGFPCSVNTIEILGKYQSMVSNSSQTSLKFVNSCLTGIKNHRFALMMALKNRVDGSMKFILRSSEIATEMVTEADNMVKQADDLVNLSLDALKAVNKDESISTAQQKEVTDMINQTIADQAQYAQEIQSLTANILELKEKEVSVAKRADAERQRQYEKGILGDIFGGLGGLVGGLAGKSGSAEEETSNEEADGNTESGGDAEKPTTDGDGEKPKKDGDGKKPTTDGNGEKPTTDGDGEKSTTDGDGAAGLDALELKITDQRMRLQQKQIEDNGKLAKIGELLKGLNAKSNDLQASIVSLQLAIIALGKVKTTFELTKQFWTGVEAQSKALSEIKSLKDLADDFQDFKEDFIQEIQKSALSWLSLGQINTAAFSTIMKAQEKTNDIMSNLPTKQEAVSIIKDESDVILGALQGNKSPALQN